ncbi:MAG TPA: DUF3291 domain-containing protein [Kofleriaceae bacterium]|nr:DUF3291 domain-containing protein [Kofleriaceae bacterium]
MWHLAQVNVARPLAPLDSPQLAEFVAQLDAVNALAEAAPGFVWRLSGASGNATDVRALEDPSLIVNMSLWVSPEALFEFVYKTMHVAVMARRRDWFERIEVFQTLWWVPTGHRPSVDEAMARLRMLREHGPSPDAFTFKRRYPAPGDASGPTDMKPEPYCEAV